MMDFTALPEHGPAWITGASSGIGRALAKRLASEGFVVAVTARDLDRLLDLQREVAEEGLPGRIIVLDGDVTDPRDMERIVAVLEYEHGGIALAVLNAGIFIPIAGDDLHRRDFERTFAVNLHGVVNCLLPAIDHMKANGQGQIAIVSSVTGYGGLPTNAAYGATSAALTNMAESLKFDLDPLGIRIQVINPGFVDTPATQGAALAMPAMVSAETAADQIAAGLKSRRFEISFPKRFTFMLKAMGWLPYTAYFPLVARATGWKIRSRRAIEAPVVETAR
ncbi:SDR family NAD(P)-dependent oxidoreductase [Sinorhizobium sp. BG8]|uniref:SDR family NAD(P)-dependent oxidoreductase n=1 Tax=Sinorhizobium sp. BG8 TaxID=2613773 RepID=UPI00193E0617|nr:SDR family NAD(P)-dependent oxidoreductase [Sinorhizobium sp. BG8]QRM55326.1 SDR family NAD(P)-dependent oxidoreductase [Sinorhizobium sp. BG8]